jgi:hypothetical protein
MLTFIVPVTIFDLSSTFLLLSKPQPLTVIKVLNWGFPVEEKPLPAPKLELEAGLEPPVENLVTFKVGGQLALQIDLDFHFQRLSAHYASALVKIW